MTNNVLKKDIKHALELKTGFNPLLLDMGIIMGLLNWGGDTTHDGWKTMKEILKDNKFFTSQPSNFPKYVKRLLTSGIIEEDKKKIKRKYYTGESYIWRLKKDKNTFRKVNYWVLGYDLENPNTYLSYFKESDYVKFINDTTKKQIHIERDSELTNIQINHYISLLNELMDCEFTLSVYNINPFKLKDEIIPKIIEKKVDLWDSQLDKISENQIAKNTKVHVFRDYYIKNKYNQSIQKKV